MSINLSTHTRRQLSYAEGYLSLGLKKEAAEALSAIASEEKDTTPVLAMRLNVHVERAQWPSAERLGRKLCEREPGIAAFWVQWAYAARRARDLSEARSVLMRGLARHPREAIFHYNLACYEAQLRNLADARVFLETACGLDGAYAELAKTDPDLEPLRGA